MLLHAQFAENRYAKTTKMITIDLETFLENPMTDTPKEELPMFNGFQNKSGVRGQFNTTGLSAIILDYDSGYTIEEFCNRYYTYRWYLYTSSSHSDSKHKFRVILPMMDLLASEDYTTDARKVLGLKFPEADPTCFYSDHFFFIPAKQEGVPYRFKINYGKLFNPKLITAQQIGLAMGRDLEKKFYNRSDFQPDIEKYESKAAAEISKIIAQPDGSGRYNQLLSSVYKFRKIGVSDRFLKECMIGYKNARQIIK